LWLSRWAFVEGLQLGGDLPGDQVGEGATNRVRVSRRIGSRNNPKLKLK
jgi:hypothetical protein